MKRWRFSQAANCTLAVLVHFKVDQKQHELTDVCFTLRSCVLFHVPYCFVLLYVTLQVFVYPYTLDKHNTNLINQPFLESYLGML